MDPNESLQTNIISVDSSWVHSIRINSYDVVSCMICYCTCAKEAKQCGRCRHLVCKDDFKQLRSLGKNVCPKCRLSPW